MSRKVRVSRRSRLRAKKRAREQRIIQRERNALDRESARAMSETEVVAKGALDLFSANLKAGGKPTPAWAVKTARKIIQAARKGGQE